MFHLTTGHIKTSQAEVAEGYIKSSKRQQFYQKFIVAPVTETAVVQCCAQCVGDSR